MAAMDVVAEAPVSVRAPGPVCKSAGGKTQLLPKILPLLPQVFKGTYHEPFVGGGAVFFALTREKRLVTQPHTRAVLGDLNPDLAACYLAIRDDVESLIQFMGPPPASPVNTREEFLKIRAVQTQGLCTMRRGARFLYLNKTAFNGLWRVNKSGQHNVPWAGYKNPTILDPEGLRTASRALQGVVILAGSFEKIIDRAVAGDVVYCDPPYFPASKTSNFKTYTKEDFDAGAQGRLEACARRAVLRGAHVVLSNADTPDARALYAPARWTIHSVEARRAVSCKGDGRGAVGELLMVGRRL